MHDIFQPDEGALQTVNPDWDEETLLTQSGLFYLKDVAKVLPIKTSQAIRPARQCLEDGGDPYREMGLRRLFGHWVVRMSVFAPFYHAQLKPSYDRLDPNWDGNDLIHQSGTYVLADVCKLLPFSAHQLRYRAKHEADARTEMGVYRDPKTNQYLVDMRIFGPWAKRIWTMR